MVKNQMKTTILLAALGGLFVILGQTFFGGGGAVIGLGIAFVFVGGSYWFSDRLAVKAARGQLVTEAEAPELYRMVADLAVRADMPMPRLYISPMDQPNAFATGRNPKHAAVCVTQGILQVLDHNELQGVLAHELGHVRNRDILISSIAAAIGTAILFLTRMAFWGAMFGGGGGDDDEGANPLVLILMMVLAPVAAMLIQMAISRSREFEADRTGADLVGNGEALATALEKIEAYAKRIPAPVNPAQASLYIVNPLTGRKVNFAGLFSTHPPTQERVARLRGHV